MEVAGPVLLGGLAGGEGREVGDAAARGGAEAAGGLVAAGGEGSWMEFWEAGVSYRGGWAIAVDSCEEAALGDVGANDALGLGV